MGKYIATTIAFVLIVAAMKFVFTLNSQEVLLMAAPAVYTMVMVALQQRDAQAQFAATMTPVLSLGLETRLDENAATLQAGTWDKVVVGLHNQHTTIGISNVRTELRFHISTRKRILGWSYAWASRVFLIPGPSLDYLAAGEYKKLDSIALELNLVKRFPELIREHKRTKPDSTTFTSFEVESGPKILCADLYCEYLPAYAGAREKDVSQRFFFFRESPNANSSWTVSPKDFRDRKYKRLS